jgi:hypothetical protein
MTSGIQSVDLECVKCKTASKSEKLQLIRDFRLQAENEYM